MDSGKAVRYADVNFNPGFMSAVDANGQRIQFTKAESDLLAQLAARPHVLMSRDRLLDSMTEFGDEASDRFIDFLVNRIRAKLGDTPRTPKFIATRYGGGYVWIADAQEPARVSAGAFIVVGPLTGAGMDDKLRIARQARAYAQALAERLGRPLDPDKAVALDMTCPAPAAFGAKIPSFQVELCFVPLEKNLECALTLRHFASGTVVRVSRETVGPLRGKAQPDMTAIERTARAHLEAIWQHVGVDDAKAELPHTAPLPIRLHDAAKAVTTQPRVWDENERRLRERIASDPDDGEAKLMLASAIHAKYVQHGMTILAHGDPRREDEIEIEALTCHALPSVQGSGVQTLTAAKLLYFVNPVFRDRAITMAREAYESTTAFASAVAVYGQIRMWEGHNSEAEALYDKGLSLCAPEDSLRFYLLTLKAQGLVAAGRVDEASPLIAKLCARAEATRKFFCLLFDGGAAVDLAPDRDAALAAMTLRQGRAVLKFYNYVCARLLNEPGHRRNVLAYPAQHLIERFGTAVIPNEARANIGFS